MENVLNVDGALRISHGQLSRERDEKYRSEGRGDSGLSEQANHSERRAAGEPRRTLFISAQTTINSRARYRVASN